MRNFVFGSKSEFDELKEQLQDGLCHVYKNCELPDGCVPRTARIGFEKNRGVYISYIDKGISTDIDNEKLKAFLRKGEERFVTYESLIMFWHSLQSIYAAKETSEMGNVLVSNEETNVVNREEVIRYLNEKENAPKYVDPELIFLELKKDIYGQDDALRQIAESIVLGKMKNSNEIITIAILGPTGTGKSETGRNLAHALSLVYKNNYGFIKCDGNEFAQEHSVYKILGAPPSYVGYGKKTLFEPVRKNPYHVIVIDEIEKANEQLLVALMEAIDRGYLGMQDNSKAIDLNKCILLFTSNLPIDMKEYRALASFERTETCMDVFTNHCGRPEISGRIKNYVVFEELSADANISIIEKNIKQVFEDFNITLQEVEPRLIGELLSFKTKYGARSIRTMVETIVGRQLLRAGRYEDFNNKKIVLGGTIENLKFVIV